jgi:hypothetical protein
MARTIRVFNHRRKHRGPEEQQEVVQGQEVHPKGDQETGSLEGDSQENGSDPGGRTPEPVGPESDVSECEEVGEHEAGTPSEPGEDTEGAESILKSEAEEGSEDES